MINPRIFVLAIVAVAYSAGFWILEAYLQQRGCAENIITAIACSHNLVSTFLCAFVFLKKARTWAKYTWASAFAVVGIADFLHGFSHWVYPLDPVAPLATVFGELYTVFLILLLISLYKSYETMSTKLDTLAGAAITGFFCTIMLIYISAPLWGMALPWYLKVFETLYTVLSSVIIAIIFVAGLRTRFASGLLFLSSFMLIFCSDFAIRFYDNSTEIAQLSLFNYGWELGFSLVAILCASLYFRKDSLGNIFKLSPFKSVRFEIGSVSFIALSLFALLFIITSNRAISLSTHDVSLLLLAFLLSWVLSNEASLWVSNNINRIRYIIGGSDTKLGGLNVEIAELLAIYQSKNDILAAAMKTIGKQKDLIERTFSYIAHDMRSPLSVLRSYVNSDQSFNTAEALEYKEAASRSVGKLLRMAEDLVDYSKASKIECSGVEIGNFINESVVAEARVKAHETGIKLLCDTNKCAHANIDTNKMGRVLLNIVHNAIQSISHNHGEIVIETKIENEKDLTISVSDNGQGIEDQHLPHIFDTFYTIGKKQGTGLGLSYCKQVVEAHDGTIDVQSEVGKGTTFSIRIPNCVVKTESAT